MTRLEERPPYTYSLANCLEGIAVSYSHDADDRIRQTMDDAYKSATTSIHPHFIGEHPFAFNQAIAALAMTQILSRNIRAFATLMQLSNDENPVDNRLVQWRDLGPFEKQIRQGLNRKLTNYYEEVEESNSPNKNQQLSSIRNALDMLLQDQTGNSGEVK